MGDEPPPASAPPPEGQDPTTPAVPAPAANTVQGSRRGSNASALAASKQGSAARLQPKLSSQKSMMPAPSVCAAPPAAPTDPAPGTPAGAPPPPSMSRQASRVSAGGAQPAPEAPPSRQPSARKASVAGTALGAAQEGAPPNISRQASRVSVAAPQQPTSRQGSYVQPAVAEEPAALTGSRRQSAAQLSRKASAVQQLSRQGSAVSAAAMRLAESIDAAAAEPQPMEQVAPMATSQNVGAPAVEEDETAGVDWRLTSQHHQQRADKLEERLRAREQELAAAEQRAREAAQRADDLDGLLKAARRGSTSAASAEVAQLRAENERLRGAEAKAQQLEQQLQAAGAGDVIEKEVVKEVVREVVPPHVEQLMDQAAREVQSLKAQAEQREMQLRSLAHQLDAAHEAIIAATHIGFEHDVKLHQARAALSALLKREKASPRMRSTGTNQQGFDSAFPSQTRDASISPHYTSPPAHQQYYPPQQYYSPQANRFSPPGAGLVSPPSAQAIAVHPTGLLTPHHGRGTPLS
eukprot:TRINITY_DN8831_c1_g2_i1.p1 TRINITY_DN8831_c1_g2~~TRINITY_DN8831_c1_g2_i1.p1  ORF type:complete len:553 (+),score=161.78 TRINITY_DN8831_c1_g2_i1:95-1660(+)